MQKYLLITAFLLTSILAFAQKDQQAAITAIKGSRTASNAAIARHDIDGMSKYWLNDFVQTIGKGTTLTGKDAIIAAWKGLFRDNSTVSYIRKPSNITISDDGTMAWETGTWTGQNSYSKGGNYSAMWRKTDGTWKIQAELYVSLYKL
ncbi:MAG TPA: nuclear transport factor 2 family protein [Mucilaginibacter sp.]|jgi:ketosteroid isomerase-like protein